MQRAHVTLMFLRLEKIKKRVKGVGGRVCRTRAPLGSVRVSAGHVPLACVVEVGDGPLRAPVQGLLECIGRAITNSCPGR